MHVAKCNKENEIHLIFFHGVGDNYKNAAEFCEDIQDEYRVLDFHAHAHRYPNTFQNYSLIHKGRDTRGKIW